MTFLLYYINVNQPSLLQLYSQNSKELFSFQKETMGAKFHEEKRTKIKFATIEAEYNLTNQAIYFFAYYHIFSIPFFLEIRLFCL